MKPAWIIFRRLVFTRPFIFAVLGLLYIVAGFLAPIVANDQNPQGWIGLAGLCFIPTAGLFALTSERMAQLCSSAGDLLIPAHSTHVRQTQALLIACFVGLPVVAIELLAGELNLQFALALLVMGAIGTTIVTIRFVGLALIVAAVVAGRTEVLWTILLHPAFQVAALLGALYLFYLWFQAPARIESNASERFVAFADTQHEPTGEAGHDDDLQRDERRLEADLALARREIAEQANVNALAFGLGFRVGTSWKSVLWGIGISAVGVLVWHFIHGRKAEVLSYLVFTAFFGLGLAGRITSMVTAWSQTPEEQSLLRLTGAWPSDAHIKRAFLRGVLTSQMGSWAGWAAVSAIAFVVGTASFDQILIGAVAMLAAASATAASFGFLLARRALKKENASTIATVLSVVIGALVCASGVLWNSVGNAATGLALIALPPLLAFCVFWLRPLNFPVKKA